MEQTGETGETHETFRHSDERPAGSPRSGAGADAVLEHGLDDCLACVDALVGTAVSDSVIDVLVIGPADGSRDRESMGGGQRLGRRPLDATVIGAGIR